MGGVRPSGSRVQFFLFLIFFGDIFSCFWPQVLHDFLYMSKNMFSELSREAPPLEASFTFFSFL